VGGQTDRIGPADIGHRVVVRRLAGSRDGRPVFRDLLGELVAYGDGRLTVRTGDGPVTVPFTEVAAGKRVPPPPPARRPRRRATEG
jgi:N-acetylglutamate synthase